MRGTGRDGCLTVDGRLTRAKTRRKMMKARSLSGSGTFIECGKSLRSRAAIWNRDLRGIESGRRRYRINFPRFRKRMRQPRAENSPQRSGLAPRPPVPIAERSTCHRDHRDRKHAPKRAIPDIGPFVRNARGAPVPLNVLGVI
jgi:hypothetical protein